MAHPNPCAWRTHDKPQQNGQFAKPKPQKPPSTACLLHGLFWIKDLSISVHCPYLYDITACLIEPVPQDDGIQKFECRGDPTGQFDLILLELIIQNLTSESKRPGFTGSLDL